MRPAHFFAVIAVLMVIGLAVDIREGRIRAALDGEPLAATVSALSPLKPDKRYVEYADDPETGARCYIWRDTIHCVQRQKGGTP